MVTKTEIFAFVLVVFFSILSTKLVLAEKLVEETPASTQTSELRNSQDHVIEAKKIDNRAKILASYLAKFDSPLQYHAQDFIDAADLYNLDWKLIPSIAGVESTFGKQIPGGFNAWGWGVYGTQAIFFDSWKDAIFTIAKGLRENYLNKGLNDPYAINKIYAASQTWGSRVTYFMQEIEKFASSFVETTPKVATLEQNPNIAAVSGQLVLR